MTLRRLHGGAKLTLAASAQEKLGSGGIGSCLWEHCTGSGTVAAVDSAAQRNSTQALPGRERGGVAAGGAHGAVTGGAAVPLLIYSVCSGAPGGGATIKCLDGGGRSAHVQVRWSIACLDWRYAPLLCCRGPCWQAAAPCRHLRSAPPTPHG